MPPDSEKSRPSDTGIVSMRTSASTSTIDNYNNTKGDNNNDNNTVIVVTSTTDDVVDTSTTNTTTMKIYTDVSCLLSNEICVDGIIYDLNTFTHHPGGTIFKSYGGNDCSIHYRFNHMTHNTAPGLVHKLLDKNMQRIGHITNYQPEYQFDTPFERELKLEVFKLLKGKEFATKGYLFRTFIYLSLFFITSYYWTTSTKISYTLVVVNAITSGFVALNISHDANHNSISGKHIWMNDILSMAVDLVGSTKWLWQQSHGGHHAYTNTEKDPDSIASEPAILFHPYPIGHPKRHWIHNFQVLYILPLVSLYWLATVLNPEVILLKEHTAVMAGIKLDNDYYKVRRKYAVLVRIIYIYIFIIRVIQNNGCTYDTISKILCMGCLGSMVVAKALFNHNFDESNRYNYNELDSTGQLQDWYKKQAESASTYGGYISGYLAGGLNYQIEHHLFPRMNSAWFPIIAPTVQSICNKHNVQYIYFPTIVHQMISFSKFLHKNGTCTMKRQWEKKID